MMTLRQFTCCALPSFLIATAACSADKQGNTGGITEESNPTVVVGKEQPHEFLTPDEVFADLGRAQKLAGASADAPPQLGDYPIADDRELDEPDNHFDSDAQSTQSAGLLAGPSKIVQASATIQSINAPTRVVILKNDDGTEDMYVAGPEIQRFSELKVGDKVNATYYESTVYELRKPGEIGRASCRERVL